MAGFNTTAFLALHGQAQTDPLVAKGVAYLRKTLGLTRVGATGYCFGGKYSFRAVGPQGGADVAFAAHPSLLEDAEISAVKGAVGVAAAGECCLRAVPTCLTTPRREGVTLALGR